MALVMVLWLMTILCAVALEVCLYARLRLQATHNAADAAESFFLATAGIERAVAELKGARDGIVTLEGLTESADRTYHNVELGRGSYTLLVGPRERRTEEFEFGIADESAKVNLNKADEAMLGRLPGMSPDLAAGIVELRKEIKQIREIEDLLLVRNMDRLALFGEDQNRNGLLDPAENDGDENWPPDNRDGRLDGGLADHLTCHSAVRNVSTEGRKRVNINKASAEEIVKEVPQISREQADSIVEQRKKGEFASVFDLLDVMLVQQGQSGAGKGQGGGSSPTAGGSATGSTARSSSASAGTSASDAGSSARASSESSSAAASQSGTSGGKAGAQAETKPAKGSDSQQQGTTATTGQKAFDLEKLKAVADLLTTVDADVVEGLVNLNTAPPEVLAALPGMDESLAAQVCARRDETPFENVMALLDVVGMTTEKLKGLFSLVSVRSDVFSVRSFGALGTQGNGTPGMYRCVSAVIDRSGDTVNLSSWREPR